MDVRLFAVSLFFLFLWIRSRYITYSWMCLSHYCKPQSKDTAPNDNKSLTVRRRCADMLLSLSPTFYPQRPLGIALLSSGAHHSSAHLARSLPFFPPVWRSGDLDSLTLEHKEEEEEGDCGVLQA